MPYRDDPDGDDDDGYKFARKEGHQTKKDSKKSKKLSARDRKRQLEDQIRTSMQSLNSGSSSPAKNMEQPSYQSSFQSSGETSYGGTAAGRATPYSTATPPQVSHGAHSSHRDYVTNAPLPQHHRQHPESGGGIMESLLNCVSSAIGSGALEIASQPSAVYESIRAVVVQPAERDRGASFRSTQQPHMQGSYQTVDIPSHYQSSGPRPGM